MVVSKSSFKYVRVRLEKETLPRRSLLALVALCAGITSAVQTIKVQGSEFVNSVTNDRFQIIGVDYQPGGSSGYNPGSGIDPLSNGTACLRDAALMQTLGINTIRMYNVDPSINHDQCASIFNAVGIYMLVDVNSPLQGENIDRSDPAGSYTASYLKRIFGVVEAFKNYPNTLGFFAGNEVINDDPTGGTVPPYIRAVQRDLKDYVAKHSTRAIPVGYSAADVRDILGDTWEYLQCAIDGSSNDTSRSDFFGLNSYSWCGGSATFQSSGYDVLTQMFSNTTIPIFFSEYGCNKVTPRVFDEVQALYGPQMTPVMSGGLIYEFSNEVSNFGLVDLNSNGTTQLLTDFDNLQSQYNKLNTTLLESGNSTATSLTAPTCSNSLISSSSYASNWTLPAVPSGGQQLIDNGISKPNNGKLVQVTDTKVNEPVYDSSGNLIQNLAIKPLPSDESNTPSGQNTSGSSSSASSSSSTATSSGTSTASASATATATGSKKKSAAGKQTAGAWILGAAVAIGLWGV
ncbi:MAG: hypothetical protein M1819_001422 [Sarea resinae]|nr:MAG: hypothetical protein M1819_001422 [Sarea resinae]